MKIADAQPISKRSVGGASRAGPCEARSTEGLIYVADPRGSDGDADLPSPIPTQPEHTDRVVHNNPKPGMADSPRQEGAKVISIEDNPLGPPRHQTVQLFCTRRWAK